MIELGFNHFLTFLVTILGLIVGYILKRIDSIDKRIGDTQEKYSDTISNNQVKIMNQIAINQSKSDQLINEIRGQMARIQITAEKSPSDKEVRAMIHIEVTSIKSDIQTLGVKIDDFNKAFTKFIISSKTSGKLDE